MKPKLYVRRQGQVLTIFVDPASGVPQPFYEWGQEPPAAFPMIPSSEELAAYAAAYDFVYIDPPTRPVLVDTSDHGAEAQQMLDRAPKSKQAEKATPRPPFQSHQTENSRTPTQRDLIISHFREIPEEDVEAVGSFLIALDPTLELDLMKARLPRTKKRFSLGGSNE